MLTPSDNLAALLIELQLCTAQQLAGCEPEVRRLLGDLPGFDTCWLDVLVAHRLLTPWQADCLQNENPRQMLQAGYRLREPLGAHTWLAETLDRGRQVVLTRLVGQTPQLAPRLMERAEALVTDTERLGEVTGSAVCLPRDIAEHSDDPGGWLVSPYVPGWQLDELLIRGGRLPWPVVVEIGTALLHGLSDVHGGGFAHGDISLRNIRLQPSGHPVLVDPFRTRLLRPTMGYRSDLTLREVQHCAPELVGSGRPSGAQSDLYALGLVLWQLLAGRPAFLSADPVNYLTQCREKDVDDVRQWVPDCPELVAVGIQALTRRRPELRVASAEVALDTWSELRQGGLSATRRLLKSLPDRRRTTVVRSDPRRVRRIRTAAAGVVVMTLCVMAGISSQVIPLPLRVRRTVAVEAPPVVALPAESESLPQDPHPVPEVLPLPQPTAEGEIPLVGGQRYHAVPIRFSGTLRIRTEGDSPAVIEVDAVRSWSVTADQLQLSGLKLIRQDGESPHPPALLSARTRVLELDRVLVLCDSPGPKAGVQWMPAADGSTVVRMQDSVLRGGRFALHTTLPPKHLELKNVLFEQSETAWRCDVDGGQPVHLTLHHVTQRDGRSFADIVDLDSGNPLNVEVVCGESVLAPQAALLRLASTQRQWSADGAMVSFLLPGRSNSTVIPPGIYPVVCFDAALQQTVELPEAQVLSESLLVAEPVFGSSGSSAASFEHARLLDFDGPKRGSRLPGVDITRLPQLTATEE